MSKVLYKRTNLPDESGYYFTNKGELYFDSRKKTWNDGWQDYDVDYVISETPPSELADVLSDIKSQIGTVILSTQQAQTILNELLN